MSRTGWLPVTAIAVLATIVIAVLASIGQGRDLSSEAFLQRALQLQTTDFRTVHSTSTGTVTMLNGDVHRRHTEAFFTYAGDMLWRQWYEGCTYPHAQNAQRCSIESVVHDNVHYQKVNSSDGQGQWEAMSGWGSPPEGIAPGEIFEIVSEVLVAGDLLELERETIDGVTYRRFRVTRRPGEESLVLIESGQCDPQEPPEGFPDSFTVEDYVNALREMFETELFTDVYWVREDNGEIWRVLRTWQKTHSDDLGEAGYYLPQRSSDLAEYSRYAVPVEIRPPIE